MYSPESAQLPPAKTGSGTGGPVLVGPGNHWGTGLLVAVASQQVSTTQGPGLDLLAPGNLKAHSLSPGQLGVFFLGLEKESSSVC